MTMQPTWVVPVQHGLPIFYKESFCASTDQVEGGDGAHEGGNVPEPVLVSSLLSGCEAACKQQRHAALSTTAWGSVTDNYWLGYPLHGAMTTGGLNLG